MRICMVANNNSIFVDTNYFVALFNPSDSLHHEALEMTAGLYSHNFVLVTSSLIFTEIVTILSLRVDHKISIEAGKYLLQDENIAIIQMDKALQQQSWNIFQNLDHKNIGLVDCSTIAIMQTEGINTLVTFDQTDFKKLQKQYRFSLYK